MPNMSTLGIFTNGLYINTVHHVSFDVVPIKEMNDLYRLLL